MRKRTARSVAPLALAAALLVVALNTWFAVSAVRSLLESEAWLTHTWEVIGQNEHLLVTVTNAESSARGFILTGLDGSLGAFQEAIHSLPEDLQHLKDLTADNVVQQANIDEARALIGSRVTMLQQVIEPRRVGGFDTALSLATTGRGNTEMDKLRVVTGRFDAEERRLLANRSQEARHNGSRALFAIALACFVYFFIIGFVS